MTRRLLRALSNWIQSHRDQLQSGCISLLAHLAVAGVLALWILPSDATDRLLSLLVTISEEGPEEPADSLPLVLMEAQDDASADPENIDVASLPDNPEISAPEVTVPEAVAALMEEAVSDLDPTDSFDSAALDGLNELGGRSGKGRQAAVQVYGGSAASEEAVLSGLRWLAKIQLSDGSWNFAKPGRKATPGSMSRTTMGATSMALLCFLGSGHTHDSPGRYRRTVKKGLDYLLQHADSSNGALDLRGEYDDNAGMYVQGLAAICLTEAHALEPEDDELRAAAAGAVKFLERTQNESNGGWRYEPRQPGDTSVTGWQVMALHSAHIGGISIDPACVKGVRQFLDSVQVREGSQYSYTPGSGNGTPSMTAVGLLCRMYMGWTRDTPALKSGVAHLSAIGPREEDIYYNYYATQVMHHWGGSEWKKWNDVMRDQLVDSQIKTGPAAGSWEVSAELHGASAGGQIFQTTLSLMTLEVYYRHLPIYRELDRSLESAVRDGESVE